MFSLRVITIMHIKENDIRPNDLENGKLDALIKDIDRLREYQKDFVFSKCPACGSDKSTHEFEKYNFNFEKCSTCRTVYMNPRATPQILSKFYSSSVLYEYWDRYIFPASRAVRKQKIFRPRVNKILSLCDLLITIEQYEVIPST